jgi:hypothetical protein
LRLVSEYDVIGMASLSIGRGYWIGKRAEEDYRDRSHRVARGHDQLAENRANQRVGLSSRFGLGQESERQAAEEGIHAAVMMFKDIHDGHPRHAGQSDGRR